jgi:hypothetical protein
MGGGTKDLGDATKTWPETGKRERVADGRHGKDADKSDYTLEETESRINSGDVW